MPTHIYARGTNGHLRPTAAPAHQVVGLASHPVVITRLQSAYGASPGIRWAADRADLYRACASGARLVVIEASDRSRETPASLSVVITALRTHSPLLPIVAYWDAAAGGGSLLPLARAGVTEIVTIDVDDGRQRLVALLDTATRHELAARVLARLGAAGVPAGASAIVRTMLQYAHRPVPVCEIAEALGVSRRTVLARLDAAGLPNPSRLAAWCRVLNAGHLIATGGRTVDGVAAELDFPSANALRNLIRRHAGLPCAALRQGGGLELAFERFMAVLLGTGDGPWAASPEGPAGDRAPIAGPLDG